VEVESGWVGDDGMAGGRRKGSSRSEREEREREKIGMGRR
jgi:hypothetical protein